MTPIIFQYPDNCVLLEFSETQQEFWPNRVVNGKSEHLPNRNGLLIISVCDTWEESYLVSESLKKIIKAAKASGENPNLSAKQMHRLAKTILAFANSYSKLKAKAVKKPIRPSPKNK